MWIRLSVHGIIALDLDIRPHANKQTNKKSNEHALAARTYIRFQEAASFTFSPFFHFRDEEYAETRDPSLARASPALTHSLAFRLSFVDVCRYTTPGLCRRSSLCSYSLTSPRSRDEAPSFRWRGDGAELAVVEVALLLLEVVALLLDVLQSTAEEAVGGIELCGLDEVGLGVVVAARRDEGLRSPVEGLDPPLGVEVLADLGRFEDGLGLVLRLGGILEEDAARDVEAAGRLSFEDLLLMEVRHLQLDVAQVEVHVPERPPIRPEGPLSVAPLVAAIA
mmetsp:Transcript_4034/g.13156  ORF Transcript_4034/g.13156 Transcript_4034/m.13156 type:complete len:279 (-) Transcript_4034:176-1012(-)